MTIFPTINKENVGSGPLPQPNVKIVDLQHNLIGLESELIGSGAIIRSNIIES